MGIILLVCLNLPPNIRYKAEHMCLVGIIPGPHEPPLTTLNHYLTPLVDDVLDFWDPGVQFSQTDGQAWQTGLLHPCLPCLQSSGSLQNIWFWTCHQFSFLCYLSLHLSEPWLQQYQLPYVAQMHEGGMSCLC